MVTRARSPSPPAPASANRGSAVGSHHHEEAGPTLHLILGPWAAGKSTLVKRLANLLPEHVVFDWDLIIPGLSLVSQKDVFTDPSTWPGLHATWFAIIGSVLDGGHDVVLCCSVQPDEVPADVVPPTRIRAAYIDCPDDELSARLAARGEPAEHIEDELTEAAALRSSGYVRLDGSQDPDALAEDATAWVQGATR